MRLLLRILAVFFFIPSLLLAVCSAQAELYLLRAVGSVEFFGNEDQSLSFREGARLPESVRIRTGNSGQVLLELRAPRRGRLTLQGQGELRWSEGALTLTTGVAFFDRADSVDEIQLQHPLGHWSLGPRSQAILSLVEGDRPRLSLLELKGSVDFYVQGRLGDQPSRSPLEALRFLAMKDEQGWVVDIYKSGDAAARGDWAKELPLAQSRVEDVRTRFELRPLRRAPASAPSRTPASLSPRESSYLCQGPSAQLNECVWRRSGERCQRARCMANGEWGDVHKLPSSLSPLCGSSARTGPCDY